MDARLAAWARAVKARRRGGLPPLWLFTDAVRVADPGAAIAGLPRGLCGVVLRDGTAAERAVLVRQCRGLRIPVVAAGERVAGAGVHLRGGRGRGSGRGLVTSSAHGRVELCRAVRAGADVVFLSPVFPTLSHPGAPVLGVLRWAALARRFPGLLYALGGVDGGTVRQVPRFAAGAGAIGALGA